MLFNLVFRPFEWVWQHMPSHWRTQPMAMAGELLVVLLLLALAVSFVPRIFG